MRSPATTTRSRLRPATSTRCTCAAWRTSSAATSTRRWPTSSTRRWRGGRPIRRPASTAAWSPTRWCDGPPRPRSRAPRPASATCGGGADAAAADDHAAARHRVLPAAVPPDPGERRLVGRGLHRVDQRAPRTADLPRPRAAARAGRARLLRPHRSRDARARRPRSRASTASTRSATTTTGSAAGGCSRRRSTRCSPPDEPDFPFCLCWANENWTRRWDGLDHEVLMAQRYGADDARAFIRDAAAGVPRPPLPARRRPAAAARLQDRRHPRPRRDRRDVARRAHAPRGWASSTCRGVAACAGRSRRRSASTPRSSSRRSATRPSSSTHGARSPIPAFRGAIFDYGNLAADFLLRPRPAFRQFRGVTPMWDNTARRQDDGMIVDGSTPEAFGVWLEHALRQTRRRHAGDERLLFVNAWNEWAEGNHLEPDAAPRPGVPRGGARGARGRARAAAPAARVRRSRARRG